MGIFGSCIFYREYDDMIEVSELDDLKPIHKMAKYRLS